MSAPAGKCEWCGGQQSWTIHAGEMFVRCQEGCQSLFPEERIDIPPPAAKSVYLREFGTLPGTVGPEEGKIL